jgi:hypothetical protein
VGLFILDFYLSKLNFIFKEKLLLHFLLAKHVDVLIWLLVHLKIKILRIATIVTIGVYSTTLNLDPKNKIRFQVACNIVIKPLCWKIMFEVWSKSILFRGHSVHTWWTWVDFEFISSSWFFLIIYYIYYLHIWFLLFSELVSSWWLLNI